MYPRLKPLGWMTLVAVAYALSGKAGLLLAIPPGYATAVWPPSGVAAAALLLGGLGLWPGVFIGSVAVNLWTSGSFDNLNELARSLMIAGGIGAGAALQAVLASSMVRMAVPHLNIFRLETGVVRLLVMAGPVACVVNATIGVSTLFVAGLIPADSFLFSWWTWWIGDCIGVLVFLPLVLVWRQRPLQRWWKRQAIVSTPTVMIFVAIVWLFFFASAREETRIRHEFEASADNAAHDFEMAVAEADAAARSVVSYFEASPAISDDGFRRFTQPILAGNAAIERLDYAEYESAPDGVQQAGPPDLRLRHSAPVSAAGVGPPPTFSLDADGSAALKAARLRETGISVAGQVSGPDGPPSYSVRTFWPVHGALTPAQQKYFSDGASVAGFLIATVKLDEIAWRTLRPLEQQGIAYRLAFQAPARPDLPLARSDGALAQGEQALRHTVLIQRGDRALTLVFSIPTAYLVENRSWQAWGLLAIGLVFTAMLCTVMLVLIGREERVEEIVAQKTSRLRIEQDQVSQLMASFPDPHFVLDEAGRIIAVNEAALIAMRRSREQVLGHPVADCFDGQIWDLVLRHVDYRAGASAAAGAVALRVRNGAPLPVRVHVSTFRSNDQPNYAITARLSVNAD
ncbi:MAG: MASE1 domain-containing protein [Stagnimonas sp.]|nr:MASE1 domain-containing protein [Stagnimonas sp.]